MMRASVVVPTCKRPALLDRCLAALAAQDFDPAAFEVIVVDDGRDDETRRVTGAWSCRSVAPVRYLPACGRGPAAARNQGWRQAHGEIIAFTDDDCIPEPDWLRTGVAAFDEGVMGAWGRVIVPLTVRPTDYERNAAGLERAEFVTANCFYRRCALAAVGGFDERFTAPWREDSDLYFRLLERADRLVRVEEAVVVHPVRPADWGISLRQQRKSMFNALLYKKHPTLYRERIQAAPPWHYYGSVAALLLGVAGLCRGRWAQAIVANGLWLGLTMQFCARRLQHTSRAPRHVAEMIVTSALIPPLSVFWRLLGALRYRVVFL